MGLLNLVELIPLDRPAWPLDPIPPYGVPSVISKAFWGGALGALLAPLLQGLTGRAYWAGWIIIGAVALSLVAFFVVLARSKSQLEDCCGPSEKQESHDALRK